MTNRNAEISPQTYARTAGIFFLIVLASSILSMMYVPSTIIVPGDAEATAATEPLVDGRDGSLAHQPLLSQERSGLQGDPIGLGDRIGDRFRPLG